MRRDRGSAGRSPCTVSQTPRKTTSTGVNVSSGGRAGSFPDFGRLLIRCSAASDRLVSVVGDVVVEEDRQVVGVVS